MSRPGKVVGRADECDEEEDCGGTAVVTGIRGEAGEGGLCVRRIAWQPLSLFCHPGGAADSVENHPLRTTTVTIAISVLRPWQA